MDALEQIRTAYVIEQLLEQLALTLPDETMKKTITAVRGDWQDLAYRITRLACGIETGHANGLTKKKAIRKRIEVSGEGTELNEESVPADTGQ